jgi:hypothetical protein
MGLNFLAPVLSILTVDGSSSHLTLLEVIDQIFLVYKFKVRNFNY